MAVRFIDRDVQVEMREEEGGRRPGAFTRSGVRHEVSEVLATWGGPGFADPRNRWKGASRTYYRVRTGDGAVYELAADWDPRRRIERWLLHRQLSGPVPPPSEAAAAPEAPAAAPARRRPRPAKGEQQATPVERPQTPRSKARAPRQDG